MSEIFSTKAHAQAWAAEKEAEIKANKLGAYPNKTLAEALHRYETEVSRLRTSGRWESIRLAALQRNFPALCAKPLHTITSVDLAAWRDARLAKVKASSVLRETSTLRDLFQRARRDWGWCGATPFADLRLPQGPPPRERVATWQEVRAILRWLGYKTGCPPNSVMRATAYGFLIALHTGMRAKEVRGLTVESVNFKARVITLHEHKTSAKFGARLVPYFPRAQKHLALLASHAKNGRLLSVSAESLSNLFRSARDACGITGLTYHDSRAFALTWMAKRIDVMRLAKISGHRNINMLVNTYYRQKAADIAASL